MSDTSQIAPRVAAVAQAADRGFPDWAALRSALLAAGFGADETEHIGGQLALDWSRPRTKFEVLSAVEAWARFHDEFRPVEGRARRRRLSRRG